MPEPLRITWWTRDFILTAHHISGPLSCVLSIAPRSINSTLIATLCTLARASLEEEKVFIVFPRIPLSFNNEMPRETRKLAHKKAEGQKMIVYRCIRIKWVAFNTIFKLIELVRVDLTLVWDEKFPGHKMQWTWEERKKEIKCTGREKTDEETKIIYLSRWDGDLHQCKYTRSKIVDKFDEITAHIHSQLHVWVGVGERVYYSHHLATLFLLLLLLLLLLLPHRCVVNMLHHLRFTDSE